MPGISSAVVLMGIHLSSSSVLYLLANLQPLLVDTFLILPEFLGAGCRTPPSWCFHRWPSCGPRWQHILTYHQSTSPSKHPCPLLLQARAVSLSPREMFFVGIYINYRIHGSRSAHDSPEALSFALRKKNPFTVEREEMNMNLGWKHETQSPLLPNKSYHQALGLDFAGGSAG